MFCFAGGCEQPRREENPFSFKHFLNRDATSGGARPKVYPSKSPSTPRLIANPELTSGLPDFVQDHLVIEQCYLNQQPSQPLSVDIHNLADFGLGLVSLPLRQTLLAALCTIIGRATMQQGWAIQRLVTETCLSGFAILPCYDSFQHQNLSYLKSDLIKQCIYFFITIVGNL